MNAMMIPIWIVFNVDDTGKVTATCVRLVEPVNPDLTLLKVLVYVRGVALHPYTIEVVARGDDQEEAASIVGQVVTCPNCEGTGHSVK